MKTITKTTTTETRYEFTHTDILNGLKSLGLLPRDAQIQSCFVRVPGGGDYSNMDLDIEENPIKVVTKQVDHS